MAASTNNAWIQSAASAAIDNSKFRNGELMVSLKHMKEFARHLSEKTRQTQSYGRSRLIKLLAEPKYKADEAWHSEVLVVEC